MEAPVLIPPRIQLLKKCTFCGVTEVFWERIFLKNVLDSSQCLQIRCEFILWYLCMSELPKLQNQWVYACIKRKNANQNWKKLKILLVSPISRKIKGNPWNFMRVLWNYLQWSPGKWGKTVTKHINNKSDKYVYTFLIMHIPMKA